MKNRIKESRDQHTEVLAAFGEAQVVRINGEVHLCGGSMADRMEALEWLSMMMPDVAVCVESEKTLSR